MPKWKLVTEFTFDSAHFIKDYDGSCGRMHGHTYKVRVEATSSKLHASEYCPHPIMVADFRSLRIDQEETYALFKGICRV
jgi:6-pyruvoyltetrahydropterin/6-carboxytetrahydropterin synthase